MSWFQCQEPGCDEKFSRQHLHKDGAKIYRYTDAEEAAGYYHEEADAAKRGELTPYQVAAGYKRPSAPSAGRSITGGPSDEGLSTPTVGAELTEQQKYELMWSKKQYRAVAPGEHMVQQFLAVAQPREHSTIIDFGAGTGRGAFMLALMGKHLKVEMLDFATNSLDEDVKEIMKDQPHALAFTQHDLTKPVPMAAEYGYCTDVMEHIPPDDVNKVLTNILQAAQHVFFQISCTEDHCGQLIGHTLHLSVHPPRWWYDKFVGMGCDVHWYKAADDESACALYVTAWATGKDVAEAGVLNIEEERMRANVRVNTAAGHRQVRPHIPQPKEVLLIGGGPSLNEQLPTIRRMRDEGCLLVTMNGAYNWALANGLSVSGTIVVDAREFNARFTKPVMPGVHYMLGSQCDPAVFEGIPREQVYLWNTTAELIKDILDEIVPTQKIEARSGLVIPPEALARFEGTNDGTKFSGVIEDNQWYGVMGGSTVMLRALPLLRMLGYMKFHLFGCDSCVSTDADHHAYPQPENDGTPVFPTIVGGRKFLCTPWQMAQAHQFIDMVKYVGNLFELEVYGDGLLAHILKHASDLDVLREEREELEEAARMK